MSRSRPPEHRNRDLDIRDEIAEFVTRFYREIAQDERFHHWFETIAHVDWHAHTAELTDFWVGELLGEPHQSADDVIEAARRRGHGIAWAMAKRLTGQASRQV